MQGGIGHRYAAHENRREFGHRCEFSRAPHLDINRQYSGELLLRRVFVRHSPARLTRHEAQALLQGEAVDFVHDAINIKGQLVALRGNALVIRY